jgi:hypothetical protein
VGILAVIGKLLLCGALLCGVTIAQAQTAAALQARYTALRPQLSNNPFNLPLHLESSEHEGNLQGDIYARIDTPYALAGPALLGMAHWCELLILHLNVKNCRNTSLPTGDTIHLAIGRKVEQPLTDTYAFEFKYTVVANDANYQQIILDAPTGPLSTSDYLIMLEVTRLDATHSFLHLSYAYHYGATARLAMQSYLTTIGRHKIGFTQTGTQANGQPIYIGNQRGVVERNTMRYYLAIVAYLGALSTPISQQLEQRLNDWYTGSEQYPLQLHELSRQQYMDMKHREVMRQQATP